jgi:Calcium binding
MPGGKSKATTLTAMAELSKADLDELVEEVIVDAYGEDEQLTGFYTMIEENLAFPFATMVLGVEVTVEGIDLTDCYGSCSS